MKTDFIQCEIAEHYFGETESPTSTNGDDFIKILNDEIVVA